MRSSLPLFVALAACEPRARPPAAATGRASGAAGSAATAERAPSAASGACDPATAPRGPGVALDGKPSAFVVTRNRPPVELAGTAAASASFTRYQRGCFQMWHARGIAGARAEVVWAAVNERGAPAKLVALLEDDREELNDYYFEQFVGPDGAIRCDPPLGLDEAMAARRKKLGGRVEQMERALAKARPSGTYARELEQERARAREAAGTASTRSLLVLAGGIDGAACFLVTGAELEPEPPELAPVLRRWAERYGAVLEEWSGHAISLRVPRPPTDLAELRALALQFFLFCPAHPSGLTSASEPADELLARLAGHDWFCSWFVE